MALQYQPSALEQAKSSIGNFMSTLQRDWDKFNSKPLTAKGTGTSSPNVSAYLNATKTIRDFGKKNIEFNPIPSLLQPGVGPFQIKQRILPEVKIPRFTVQNPVLDWVANFPGGMAESIINSPRQLQIGTRGLNQNLKDFTQGKQVRPQEVAANAARTAELPLNFLTGGAATGVRLVTQQALKEIFKRAAVTGAKYGLGFGAITGFESGQKIEKPQDYAKNLAVNIILGGAAGVVLGGGLAVGGKVTSQVAKNVKNIISDYVKMSPAQQNKFLQAGFADFSLTYPEKVAPQKGAELAAKQGGYSRDFSGRLERGKPSTGDLQRLGINITRTDLKTLYQNLPEFKKNPTMVFKDGNWVFEGPKAKFSINTQALGIDGTNYKNGDTLNISNILKDKGSIPVVAEVKPSGGIKVKPTLPQAGGVKPHIKLNFDKETQVDNFAFIPREDKTIKGGVYAVIRRNEDNLTSVVHAKDLGSLERKIRHEISWQNDNNPIAQATGGVKVPVAETPKAPLLLASKSTPRLSPVEQSMRQNPQITGDPLVMLVGTNEMVFESSAIRKRQNYYDQGGGYHEMVHPKPVTGIKVGTGPYKNALGESLPWEVPTTQKPISTQPISKATVSLPKDLRGVVTEEQIQDQMRRTGLNREDVIKTILRSGVIGKQWRQQPAVKIPIKAVTTRLKISSSTPTQLIEQRQRELERIFQQKRAPGVSLHAEVAEWNKNASELRKRIPSVMGAVPIMPSTKVSAQAPFTKTGLPSVFTGERKERGIITSVKENPTIAEQIRKTVSGTYNMTSDAGRLAYGEAYIVNNVDEATRRVLSAEPVSPELDGIASALFRKAQSEGHFEDAKNIVNAVAERITPSAQSLQFAKYWSQSTLKGMMEWAKSIFGEANEISNLSLPRLIKAGIGKDYKIELTPNTEKMIFDGMTRIQQMAEGPEKTAATKQLMLDITKDITPGVMVYVDAYRYQNMLSGLGTQLKNLYSNLWQTLITRPATIATNVGLDIIGSVLKRKGMDRSWKEVPSYYKAALNAFPNAIEAFKEGFRLQNVSEGKIDLQRTGLRAFTSPKIPRSLQIAPSILEGTDRYFQTLIAAGEYVAQRSRGVEETVAKSAAEQIAKYSLFRQQIDPKGALGQGYILRSIDGFTDWIIKGRKVVGPLGWFIPFVRVPMAVAKTWLEYTPFGTITIPGAANKSEQLAKALLGTVALGIGANYAMNDKTTWAVPIDQKEKEYFFASGKKPYSLLINGVWVPMQFFGPFALALAIPAAFKYNFQDKRTALTDSMLDQAVASLTANLGFFTQQTFMSGLGQFVRLAEGDIDKSLSGNLAFTSTQLLPLSGLQRTVANILDPIFRKADGFIESIQRNIPIMSTGLAPYTDPAGEPSRRNSIDPFLPWAPGFTQGKEDYSALLEGRQAELQQNAINNKVEKIQGKVLDGSMSEEEGTKQIDNLLEKQFINVNVNVPDVNLVPTAEAAEESKMSPQEKLRARLKAELADKKAELQVKVRGNSIFTNNKIYYADKAGAAKKIDLSSFLKPATGMAKYTQESDMYKELQKMYGEVKISDDIKAQVYKTLNIDPQQAQYDYFASQPTQPTIGYFMDALKDKSKEEILKTLLTGRQQSLSGNLLAADAVITGLVEQGLITRDEGKYLKDFKFTIDGKSIGANTAPKKPKVLKMKAPKKLKISKVKLGKAPKVFKPLKLIQYKPSQTPKVATTARVGSFKPKAINTRIKVAGFPTIGRRLKLS